MLHHILQESVARLCESRSRKAFEAIIVYRNPEPDGFRAFNPAVYLPASFGSNNRLPCGCCGCFGIGRSRSIFGGFRA